MPSGLGRLLISHCHWGGFPLIVTKRNTHSNDCTPSPGLSRHSVMRQFPLSLSFPSGVPSDARRWPFSYTACVSQASGSSELIPCIRLQTREIVSLVVFFRHSVGFGVMKNSHRNIPNGTAVA